MKSTFARLVTAGVVCALGMSAYISARTAHAQTRDNRPKPPASAPGDKEIIETLQLAYRWGYPLMAMAINNAETYGTTINAFYNMKTAADDKAQNDKGFNAETLYSAGALDLDKEPVVFTMPPVGDRFVVFPVQDAWGNIDNVIGTRTEGNAGGNYLISGPGWKGEAPAGMKHFRLHTSIGFLPGRSMVKSPEDAKAFAATTQDQYVLTPLSRWGKGAPNPNRDSLKDPLHVDPARNYNAILLAMPTSDYFNKLNALLVKNPPYDYDQPVLEKFAKLGIGPGLTFNIEAFSPAVRSAMEEFGRTDPKATAAELAKSGMNPRLAALCARFGTAYYERYLLVFGGLGGNVMEDALYFWLNQDASGAKLNGNDQYVVRFEAGQIPRPKAFWSLTLYTTDFYLPKDMPLNRHVRNSNSGMKVGADGSLEVYLQAENPGPDKESNWLPTPREEFFVILRAYWPAEDMLSGTWQTPPVRKVN